MFRLYRSLAGMSVVKCCNFSRVHDLSRLTPEFNFCYFGLFVVVVFLHIHVFSAFSKQRVPKTTDSARKNWCSAWVLKMPNSAQNSAGVTAY